MDFSGRGMEGDLFDMLNGGGMGGFMGGGGLLGQMFGGGSRRRKGETTVQPLSVTLEDLYNGKNSKLQLTKKALCKTCNGVGGKPGSVKRCEYCRGSGRVFTTRQIGPGMLQQIASQCDNCDGGGENIDAANRCKTCNGRKTVQEQKIIEVKVEPGMRDNQKIVFYGEGDQEPGIEPGDVVLVIKTKPHAIFDRKNDDLFIKKDVTLKQALCGFTSTIKHLNGKDIVVNTLPEEVIKPESVRVAFGKGMPKHGKPGEYGNLYFVFNVTFPPPHFFENENRYMDLEALLPPRQRITKLPSNIEVEEVTLSDFDSHRYDRSGGGGGGPREAYHDDDSDDDMPSGAQHVQCAQQ
ncbi:CR-type domain-containing protein [Meloidogyne graminicola]|uniref:CR-type domain-containing protein n=1 Tax=Meloidogyne graminicola TaxID=189291 RepID=A0A8S9ZD54_9BILA|nr:CR-type domain-containing protein [Meloidogyne graminicola]